MSPRCFATQTTPSLIRRNHPDTFVSLLLEKYIIPISEAGSFAIYTGPIRNTF